MINHEFDIIRVLIASQDDEMIKKLNLVPDRKCILKQSQLTIN